MRYRVLSPSGDYVFGRGAGEFLANSPACVAQLVETRLALWSGQWFLDANEGTPYFGQVLGMGTGGTYDQAIQQRILATQGVTQIVAYASNLDRASRVLTVTATIDTQYGTAVVTTDLNILA